MLYTVKIIFYLFCHFPEVTTTPAPGLIYRTNGGILDIYYFFGPQPEAVIAQYTEVDLGY